MPPVLGTKYTAPLNLLNDLSKDERVCTRPAFLKNKVIHNSKFPSSPFSTLTVSSFRKDQQTCNSVPRISTFENETEISHHYRITLTIYRLWMESGTSEQYNVTLPVFLTKNLVMC